MFSVFCRQRRPARTRADRTWGVRRMRRRFAAWRARASSLSRSSKRGGSMRSSGNQMGRTARRDVGIERVRCNARCNATPPCVDPPAFGSPLVVRAAAPRPGR